VTVGQSLLNNFEQIYATVEEMISVKKTLEKVEAEDNPIAKKENDFKGQLTQLEATLRLDKVMNKLSSFPSEIFLF
jgi:hypothetical protein